MGSKSNCLSDALPMPTCTRLTSLVRPTDPTAYLRIVGRTGLGGYGWLWVVMGGYLVAMGGYGVAAKGASPQGAQKWEAALGGLILHSGREERCRLSRSTSSARMCK
jgi:hypothetical protein